MSTLTRCLLPFVVGAITAGAAVFGQDLVLHYTLTKGAADQSGLGHDGVVVGDPVFEPNQCGDGVRFENPLGSALATEYIILPDLSEYGEGSFTIALRLRSMDVGEQNGRLFGNNFLSPGIAIGYNRGGCTTASIALRLPGETHILFDASAGPERVVTDGQCHWLVLVIDRKQQVVRGHVDGAVQSQVLISDAAANMREFWLGAISEPAGSGRHYAARLTAVDELRVYNGALSECAVSVLRGCSTDRNCDGIVNSTDVSSFINDWFLDQVEGTMVTDWDHNGVVNSTDVSSFINGWFENLAAGCG